MSELGYSVSWGRSAVNRSTILITIGNRSAPVTTWAAEWGVRHHTIRSRLERSLPLAKLCDPAVRKARKAKTLCDVTHSNVSTARDVFFSLPVLAARVGR